MNQDFLDLLRSFVAPLNDFTAADLATPGVVYQIGLPPGRIDVLTQLPGLTLAEAWPGRVEHHIGDLRVPVIGREAFILNKRATGRAKDLGDIEDLA
jgi:hypothetical protein